MKRTRHYASDLTDRGGPPWRVRNAHLAALTTAAYFPPSAVAFFPSTNSRYCSSNSA